MVKYVHFQEPSFLCPDLNWRLWERFLRFSLIIIINQVLPVVMKCIHNNSASKLTESSEFSWWLAFFSLLDNYEVTDGINAHVVLVEKVAH